MSNTPLPDGTDALMAELSYSEVMRLIERTAKWVDPKTFQMFPVWYPEHARRGLLYKSNWSEPLMNTNRQTGVSLHKAEANIYASKALSLALGLGSNGRPKGWTCCHIWGVDDPSYQMANLIVQDPRFFSCVANMVLLPTPLKAFTDTVPEVKSMLRICALNTYGWQCDHEQMDETNKTLRTWKDWGSYPASWPREPQAGVPMGIMPLTAEVKDAAARRWQRIQNDIYNAGQHYPRDSVRNVLDYWGLEIGSPISDAR